MFHNSIHTAAARTLMQSSLQLRQILRASIRNNLHLPVFSITNPPAQPNLCRLPLHKPAKPDALNSAFNKVMAHHGELLYSIHISIGDKPIANHLPA